MLVPFVRHPPDATRLWKWSLYSCMLWFRHRPSPTSDSQLNVCCKEILFNKWKKVIKTFQILVTELALFVRVFPYVPIKTLFSMIVLLTLLEEHESENVPC